MTFKDMIEKVLRSTKKSMTPSEIWEYSKNNIKEFSTTGKTPVDSITAMLYTDLKYNDDSIFAITSKKPTRFMLKEFIQNTNKNSENIEYKEEISKAESSYDEIDMHPLLTTFVANSPDFNCYTKTINASKSTKQQKGKNKWLHPDIVGVNFAFESFVDNSFMELYKNSNDNLFTLYSFELKKKLSFENLREFYFQALSNSAWAHEGYLVVMEISDKDELLKDYARLNNAFGIGLIQLDIDNLQSSEVLFGGKSKQPLDWDTISLLSSQNDDIKHFIEKINSDIKNSRVLTDHKKIETHYDKVLDEEQLQKHLKKFA